MGARAGTVPLLGLGTATLKGERCAAAVAEALRLGYTHIDTALLYGNQAAVGEGIRRAGAARRDVWVTSKVRPCLFVRAREFACLPPPPAFFA